jgi:elongation factor P
MATANDLKNGSIIRRDGEMFQVMSFQHVKPGKGGAFVRTKLKGVTTGKVIEVRFRSEEEVEEVRLERRGMQFLYSTDDIYYFMNMETYEQIPLPESSVEDVLGFLKEGMDLEVLLDGSSPVTVELPTFVELEIAETSPGIKGDTVSGGSKPAKLETGATIQVPLFINEGDVVKVDTRSKEYVERV